MRCDALWNGRIFLVLLSIEGRIQNSLHDELKSKQRTHTDVRCCPFRIASRVVEICTVRSLNCKLKREREARCTQNTQPKFAGVRVWLSPSGPQKAIESLKWVVYPFKMEHVQFSDALRLTELSNNQLREWCGKRGLFQPAVPARGPGKVALYSWQDLVALRVFREIFSEFGGRASSWAVGVGELRECLSGQFFPNLWGQVAIFPDQSSAYLGTNLSLPTTCPALFVPLDPHLDVISQRATPEELQGKLPLFTKLGSQK